VMSATFGASAAMAQGGTLADEPLPTPEEIRNASDCEELARLWAGVNNEEFRLNALVEKGDANATFDREAYLAPLHERESEIVEEMRRDSDDEATDGCQEAFVRADIASEAARCDAWFGLGHDLNEEPLLMNTLRCVDQPFPAAASSGPSVSDIILGLIAAIPALILLLSPFTGYVSLSKGSQITGWMGMAAVPAVVIIYLLALLIASRQDFSGFDGIGFALLWFTLMAGTGLALSMAGLVGALQLAKPTSRWALKRYSDEKMAQASTRRYGADRGRWLMARASDLAGEQGLSRREAWEQAERELHGHR